MLFNINNNSKHVSSSSAQSSCPEGALQSRHTSINSQRSGSIDFGQNSPPSHHLHTQTHPGPNSHSSPRGSQLSRMVQFNMNRSPALSFEDEPDGPSYESQLPPLPEKMRDCERSLGSVSPAPSGFSSPHSGSSLSIPFPSALPELHSISGSPLPG